jgi:signal transduction histidine kinase
MQTQQYDVGLATAFQTMIATEGLQEHVEQTRGCTDRLAVVRHTDLLDTQPEEAFDALTRLAASMIGASVSFLSVVDGSRDFYKSQCGFPESLASTRQLSGRTFCHYAVAGSAPLVIDDTHAHPTWRVVPVVNALAARSYLGVPVFVDGQAIGTFCVLDSRPRNWKESEIEVLVQLSLAATREIQLRAALRLAKVEAQRANSLAKANEELLAVVSHDIRTPVQVILLCAKLLSLTASERERAHLDRLVRATDLIRSLMDTLVPACMAHSSVIPVQRAVISSGSLLKDAVDTMGMVAERAGIDLGVAPDCAGTILVDYPQMLRVLGNLIGNCMKYCPAGSSVTVSARELGGRVLLAVSDDGPGMSRHDQDHAFERGWQGKNASGMQDGSGLGLAIVRGLVEQNKGSVALDSALGRGTKVTITLPAVLKPGN